MESYRPIDNQLVAACQEYPPDFCKIRSLLDQGADVNAISATDEDECLLSEIILGYPRIAELLADDCGDCDNNDADHPKADGRYLPLIIQVFLEQGFDATGRMGAICLQNLSWASYDQYILDACKLLMAAGADPNAITFSDDEETVISWVGTKASAADCVDHDPAEISLFEAMYRMMEAKIQGRNYELIEHFSVCIGQKICGISLCADDRPLTEVFSVNTPTSRHQNCFVNTVVLDCQGKMLCVSRYTELYVDPHVPQYAEVKLDLAPYFQNCIGHTIVGIDFSYREIRENRTSYGQPIILIQLDNGKTLRFSHNFGEVDRNETAAWFEVVD